MEPELLQAALVKMGVFVLVQALVCLIILSQSSAMFSRTKTKSKSPGLRPARSLSLSGRRMLALLSDLPAGGEPSPVAVAWTRPSRLVLPDRRED